MTSEGGGEGEDRDRRPEPEQPRDLHEPQSAAEQGGKVVPLPRDWLGPREDLVPFGPSAGAGPPEEDGGEPPEPALTEVKRPVSPEDFWGEHSAALQGAVDERDALATAAGRPRLSIDRLRRPMVVGAIAAAVALVVVGYLNVFEGSPSSPIASRLSPGLHGSTSPWMLPRHPSPVHPVEPPTHSQRRSHHASRNGAVPVKYTGPATVSSGVVSTTSTESSPASVGPSVPASSPTVPTSPSPPTTSSPTRSTNPAFGARGALGPGHSPSG